MRKIFISVREFLVARFNLSEDKADEKEVIESITRNVEFRGTNLWTLIFAIFIASIGLNVNATAVIIGAMLISPLMGPIVGMGLGIGINDLSLIKKALKNLLIAVVISVITSYLYFKITPLHEAQSELLARTVPTIWDVFIAFFGGLAGIVAGTRSQKTNVIPGVAIATALMPPLCTVGFGLAAGNLYYAVGAFYLFFINSVFICISTFLIVRLLRFRKKEQEDPKRQTQVTRAILLVVIITVLPSIYLAYRIVDRSIFEANANRFLQKEFNYAGAQIVGKTLKYEHGTKEIDLLLIGEELDSLTIDTLKNHMHAYKLDSTRLVIRQGLNARQQIDLAQVKASILEDVYSHSTTQIKTQVPKLPEKQYPNLSGELKALYPEVVAYSISKSAFTIVDSARSDSVTIFVATTSAYIAANRERQMRQWLSTRLHADSLLLLFHRVKK